MSSSCFVTQGTVKEIVGNEQKNLDTFSFYQDEPAEKADEVVYNLNTVERILLKDKFKINEGFAKEIIDVKTKVIQRNFVNINDLYMVMYEYYSNKLDKNTSFTPDKITSFKKNFNVLREAIVTNERLVIKE